MWVFTRFCIQQHIHKIIFYNEKFVTQKSKILAKLMMSTEKFSEIISYLNISFFSDSRD
jgi:hypothetical protein